MNSTRDAVDGVLLLDKPPGLTSQQAVSRVKRLLQAAKAGHAGTLDPLATGLLPVALGEATKFSQFILDADKTYLATLHLGITTATGDAEGEVLQQQPVRIEAARLQAALQRFSGPQTQTPPMYSALKVNGKPLYRYARDGINLPRKSREIRVHEIQVIDFKEEFLKIRVRCSKGTYIRVLAEDIGKALGCGAHLQALVREAAGRFVLKAGISLEALEGLSLAARRALLMGADAFALELPRLDLAAREAASLACGQILAYPGVCDGSRRIYGPDNRFMGVGEVLGGRLTARRLTRSLSGGANDLSKSGFTG